MYVYENLYMQLNIIVNKVVICPAVSFVLSNISCAIKHMIPDNKNALIKIISLPLFLFHDTPMELIVFDYS